MFLCCSGSLFPFSVLDYLTTEGSLSLFCLGYLLLLEHSLEGLFSSLFSISIIDLPLFFLLPQSLLVLLFFEFCQFITPYLLLLSNFSLLFQLFDQSSFFFNLLTESLLSLLIFFKLLLLFLPPDSLSLLPSHLFFRLEYFFADFWHYSSLQTHLMSLIR